MPRMARKKTTDDTGTQKRTGDRHKPRRTIALTPELYEQLTRVAEANARPIQWEAAKAIKEHVASELARIEAEEAKRKQG